MSSPEMYIRLTSLEMERARRILERDRLLQRARTLDERIIAITQEQADMRGRIDRHDNQSQTQAPADSSGRTDSGFGFTY